jgi:hypothetical protein
MHNFEDLIQHGAHFMLAAIDAAEQDVSKQLETSGAARHVKALQMLQLQRAVLAVGMFSMLEAHLQRPGDGKYAFNAVAARLRDTGEPSLGDEFTVLKHAINALKHGRGPSYATLTEIPADRLPFRIKREGDYFFQEGEVGEVATLVEVDSAFLLYCAETVKRVSEKLC